MEEKLTSFPSTEKKSLRDADCMLSPSYSPGSAGATLQPTTAQGVRESEPRAGPARRAHILSTAPTRAGPQLVRPPMPTAQQSFLSMVLPCLCTVVFLKKKHRSSSGLAWFQPPMVSTHHERER